MDFVFEFAKDLKKVIELIEQDYDNNIFLGKNEILKKLMKMLQNLHKTYLKNIKRSLNYKFKSKLVNLI